MLFSWPFALMLAVGVTCLVSGYANRETGPSGLFLGPLVGAGLFLVLLAVNRIIKKRSGLG